MTRSGERFVAARVRSLAPLLLTIVIAACGGQPATPTPTPPTVPAKPTTAPAAPTSAATATAPAKAAATTPPAATAPAAPAAAPNAGSGGATQALIDAAKKEGTLVWYTAIELKEAEKVAKKFEEKYGIKVEVNRSGSERVLQRVMQEAQANVNAVDIINTADTGHYVLFKREKMLAAYTPASVAKLPSRDKDQDGYYFSWRYVLATPAYNPQLVKGEEAPKTWQDLLDPKWKGKMVSAHPSYSGNIVSWVAAITEVYKTDYLESLAQQDVMLVQSALDPVTKVSSGERAIAVNGSEYTFWDAKLKGNPVETIYPTDGVPMIPSPSGIAATAPHPNSAKLFQEYIFDTETQQMLVDDGQYSPHPDVKYPTGRKLLSEMKILTTDENKLEKDAEQLKKAFTRAFGS